MTPADDPSEDNLAASGEDGLVASVLARYGVPPGWVVVGPGDDAAVLDLQEAGRPGVGGLVVSTDTLVEGQDFRRGWADGHDVGVKSAAQNFADVAAMGAVPRALVVSLAAPADLPTAWARALADGLAEECRRAGAVVVGGDVSRAGEIVVTGTALGMLEGVAPVRRDGARAGDVVALAGGTGSAAAGLALLEAGVLETGVLETGVLQTGVLQAGVLQAGPGEQLARLVQGQLRPQPPYPAGPAAARAGATSMIDVSDGLIRDAARLAVDSGAVLDLEPAALTPSGALYRAAQWLADAGCDVDPDLPRRWVLTGGEDHALLATFPLQAPLPDGFRAIGRVHAPATGEPPGVRVAGVPWTGPTGWRHFSSP